MGSGCTKDQGTIKDINELNVDNKNQEEVDGEMAMMMTSMSGGANFKLKLEIIDGPHKGEHHEKLFYSGHETWKLGNDDEECQLLFTKDEEISGEHGKIVFNGSSHAYYYDLDSTNGSWVNENKVESGTRYHEALIEGTVIRLGPHTKIGVFEVNLNGIEQDLED